MKKVLIVTYYWPPSGGSGVQRWMYFAKYLSDFGIQPVILTVSEKYASYRQIDNNLSDEVKNIEVYKTASFEPLKIYSLLTSGNSKKGIPQGEIKSGKGNIIVTVSRFIRGSLFIPDARKMWNIFAFRKAEKIIKDENINVVITTGPPHSTHFIGNRLKNKFKLKWIADFRDPWSDLYYNKDLIRTKRAERKDKRLEKIILEKSDIVLTVGEKMKSLLQSKSNKLGSKIYTVFNGYDAELFNKIPKQKSEYFNISYIGLLTQNSPYKAFAESVKLFSDKIENKKNIILNFAGNIDDSILSYFKNLLPEIKINIHGYISHYEAVRIMKYSNILISCLPEMSQSEILVSGKTAEYIASGNPVLSFGNPESESAEMLNNLEFSLTCSKDEKLKAAEFILFIYEKYTRKEIAVNNIDNSFIKNLSRYETTGILSEIIKKQIEFY